MAIGRYVRLTTLQRDWESHSLKGVFQAAYELRDSDALDRHEETTFRTALDWLGMHLKAPACLRNPANFRAICWFHPRAVRPMQYIWEIVNILHEHGIYIRLHKTARPGLIIYEDGWQVVAKPWRRMK